MIRLTDSLSGKKVPLEPLVEGQIKMYVCGPTVYGYTHVGNARPYVFFDVVKRYLTYRGYHVLLVRNLTDVDDKIINRAREEKTTPNHISEKYTQAFIEDMAALGVSAPDRSPKVTETIGPIITLIEGLIAKGFAYVTEEGEVLYSVRKFTSYGKLSKKNIDDLISGARVATDEKKKDPLDFSLWKPQKKEDEPAWDSPWGKGRPGWHIECSAMAFTHLGESFDIHGGGIDLMHPHHENEIAQSEAFTQKPFAKYWMHNNLVSIQNEKMSKSLGNIFLNRDFIQKYTAETLRFLLLSAHYRSTIDFSEKNIRNCQAALHRIYSTVLKCEEAKSKTSEVPSSEIEKQLLSEITELEYEWSKVMEDDFNTPRVFALVFERVRSLNAYFDKKGFKPSQMSSQIAEAFLEQLGKIARVINVFGEVPSTYLTLLRNSVLADRNLSETIILEKIENRRQARINKNFALSDNIRDDLKRIGIELKDTAQGTSWDVIFHEEP